MDRGAFWFFQIGFMVNLINIEGNTAPQIQL
jgi:hypothetical protein